MICTLYIPITLWEMENALIQFCLPQSSVEVPSFHYLKRN